MNKRNKSALGTLALATVLGIQTVLFPLFSALPAQAEELPPVSPAEQGETMILITSEEVEELGFEQDSSSDTSSSSDNSENDTAARYDLLPYATLLPSTPELLEEDPQGEQNSGVDTYSSSAQSQRDALLSLLGDSAVCTERELSALSEEALSEEADLEDENCLLRWLFNWLFGGNNQNDINATNTAGGIQVGQTYYDPTTQQKVTGVQKINGKLYYFNQDGVCQDVKFGIDVSYHQGALDWQKVKAAGVSYAIIRAGYRGYKTGAMAMDTMFETHFNGAKNAGLKVGIYFFSQAVNALEAQEEASACINLLAGRQLDYPIYFDTEAGNTKHTGRADSLSSDVRTSLAITFCETVCGSGYRAGVYASRNWFLNDLSLNALTRYKIWNAHYGVSAPNISCNMWQYTYQGTIDGIDGKFDLDVDFNT